MTEGMVEAHNSVISDDDLVYIVGDFCLGGGDLVKEYLSRLNGRKFLIRGNHDRPKSNVEAAKCGYEEVVDKMILEHDRVKIGLSHYPFRKPTEMRSKYELAPEECDVLVHGHVHDLWKTKIDDFSKKLMINVSVEVLEYKPIPIEHVIMLYRQL